MLITILFLFLNQSIFIKTHAHTGTKHIKGSKEPFLLGQKHNHKSGTYFMMLAVILVLDLILHAHRHARTCTISHQIQNGYHLFHASTDTIIQLINYVKNWSLLSFSCQNQQTGELISAQNT